MIVGRIATLPRWGCGEVKEGVKRMGKVRKGQFARQTAWIAH